VINLSPALIDPLGKTGYNHTQLSFYLSESLNMSFRNGQDIGYKRAQSVGLSTFMSRVYAWMMMGIVVTGSVAYYIGNTPELVVRIFQNQVFFWAVVIVQFLAVIYLSAAIRKISATAAAITFLAYSALTGLTLSLIFVIYTQQSLVLAFATTAAAFGGLSLYGYATHRDLGPLGSFCIMGFFGLIAVMLLAFFIPSLNSNAMQLTISSLGVLIFAGLTAYDTQKIKSMAYDPSFGANQRAIYGALVLYLDFLNLFLFILRLMGDRK
jgi:FtsH-binding integral membrane protein